MKVQAGEVSTYVYRLKYARAATTALAITALYTGNVNALMALAAMAKSSQNMGDGRTAAVGGRIMAWRRWRIRRWAGASA